MTQNFDFEVNIEKRMPTTGKVFMVDRMTSDYAQAHPFDVDGFLEEVYQKWADCEILGFRETREALRNQWIKTLSVTRPSGDASIYPNNNGAHHPALMEVWMKAGDYWRAGLRLGDQLPAIVPSHKITRLGNGEWICLFPKDMGLLSTHAGDTHTGDRNPVSSEIDTDVPVPVCESSTFVAAAVNHGDCPSCEQRDDSERITSGTVPCDSPSEQNHAPVELDLFAQMQMEMQALREENERLKQCNMIQMRTAVRAAQDVLDTENCPCETQGQPSPTRRQRRERRREQDVMALHTSPAITVSHDDDDHSQRNMKIFAAVATAAVFLVLVNTVGLFGVAALGLLAGGLVK